MKLVTSLKKAVKNPNETKFLKLEINDHLPKEIENLVYLEELYLKGNFSQWDLDLKELVHLKKLTIQSPLLENFPQEVLKLPQLENLKLIEGQFKSLILPLEILSPLLSLTIKDTQLSNLPMEFAQLQELKELNLAGNKLNSLPLSLGDLKKIQRINIDRNDFSKLDDVIKKCPSLRHLSCDGNPFSEEEKFRIQREFNIFPH